MTDRENSIFTDKEMLKLDEYIMKLPKEDIKVPDILTEKINQRLSSIKPRRRYALTAVIALVLASGLFTGGIRLSPSFAAYAAEIPGLKSAVEWLSGDRGIKNAKNKGYKEAPSITVVEDKYKLELNNILMDEDRIYLSAVLSEEVQAGMPAADGKSQEAGSEKPVRAGYAKPDYNQPYLSIDFLDFKKGSLHMSSLGSDTNGILTRQVEKVLNDGEMLEFMSSNSGYLTLAVKLYRGDKMEYDFKPVHIPVEKGNFMASKRMLQDILLKYTHTEIALKQFVISPTRMRLDINLDMEPGYSFAGFENACLKDDRGNIYKPEGLISSGASTNQQRLYFVPSIYFDTLPTKLYFSFDGIRISSDKGKSFSLNINEQLPRKLEYMGETVEVRDIAWDKAFGLKVVCGVPDKNILSIQNLALKNYGRGQGSSNYTDSKTGENILETTFFNVEKREMYDLEFEFPGFFIKAPSKIKLQLN